MAGAAPRGGNLAAVKEEEVVDPWGCNFFYESLGARTPAEIDENSFRKREIRRQWVILSARIAEQLETAAKREIGRHLEDGPVLIREKMSNMNSEEIWDLAAALSPVECFESITLDPAIGDMKKNLEEFILLLVMELEKEERRDINRGLHLSREDAKPRVLVVELPEMPYAADEFINPELAKTPTLSGFLADTGALPYCGMPDWRAIVHKARTSSPVPEGQGGGMRNRMLEKIMARQEDKDRELVKPEMLEIEENLGCFGNSAASSSSRPTRPTIRVLPKEEQSPPQGGNLAASSSQAAPAEDEEDDPNMPKLVASPKEVEDPWQNWSPAPSEADVEVPEELVTPLWNYDKHEAKKLNQQLMQEGPTMNIAKMVEKGIGFPIVSLEFPPSLASLKVKQKQSKRDKRCMKSPNAITLMELREDKLLSLLVTSRMANTGNIEKLLTMVINADTLYQAILTELAKASKPKWEYDLAHMFLHICNNRRPNGCTTPLHRSARGEDNFPHWTKQRAHYLAYRSRSEAVAQ